MKSPFEWLHRKLDHPPGAKPRLDLKSADEQVRPQKKWWELIALLLLFATISGINFAWLVNDNSLIPIGDAYLYLTPLLKFLDGLDELRSPSDLWSSLDSMSHQGRPPLYQLMTIPSILLFGRSVDSALSVNVLFLAILIASTYSIGCLVKDGKTGLLAALLVSCYPPIVHLSRMYLPHFALPACAALSICLLLLLIRKRSIVIAWLLGTSLAFGLLMHPQFVWILPVPTAIFGAYLVFFQTRPIYPSSLKGTLSWLWVKLRDPFVIWGLLPGFLIALGLTLAWYTTSGIRILELLQTLSTPELAEFRGVTARSAGFPDIAPTFWWFARTAPGAISNILTIFMVLGLASLLFKRSLQVSVLTVTLIASYTGLSLLVLHAWMHFSVVLPVAASITAVWIAGIRHKWLRKTLPIVCIAVSAFNFYVVTWGFQPWSQPLAITLGSPIRDMKTCKTMKPLALCPNPAQVEQWPLREIEQKILKDPNCQKKSPCALMTIMGIPTSLFNYHLTRYRLHNRLKVTSMGYKSQAKPFNLSGLLKSEYIIYPDLRFSSPAGNSYAVASVRFLQSPPASFADAHQEVGVFEYPKGTRGRLIRRIKPLSTEEAEASIAALELDERYKSERFPVMIQLYLSENRLQEATEVYHQITDLRLRRRSLHLLLKKHRSSGNSEQLIPLYKDALEANPKDLSARIRLGKAYERLGKTEAAISELEKAIAIAPESPWPRRALADIYRLQRQFEPALKLYLKALEIHPKDFEARVRLGEVYYRTGKTDAAITEFEKATTLAPQNPWPLKALAKAYLSQGRQDQAITVYQRILEVNPKDGAVRETLDRLAGSEN